TLLVGMLPLIYAIAKGAPVALPLSPRQEQEILLTAAQSLFAVLILLDLSLSLVGALGLFALFAAQFLFPELRLEASALYVALGLMAVFLSRRQVGRTFAGLRSGRGGPSHY